MGRVSDAKVRLMEAVSELIWTGSYGSTTIDQICEKAGVKKGSFYYFFDSKADLALTSLEQEWQRRRTELDSLFSLGSEVSTQEVHLQKKVQGILDYKRKYLETAIRDAHAAGLIHAPDAAGKARTLFVYYQGLLTQARIENSLDSLRDSLRGTYDILGVKEQEPVPA